MRSRGARIAIAGLGLLGLVLLVAALAIVKRTALAEWLVRRELAARGVPAELRVVRLDLHGAELADVRLGAPASPDLALAHAEVGWSAAGLRAERLDRIALRGLRVRARVDGNGVRFGTLDALTAGGAPEPGAPLALPFLEATLADAEATLDSPQGALRLRAAGSAAPEGDLVRATLTLHGESPQGALDFGGGATVGLVSQEIAAAGALAGATPWGSAEGNVRAFGTLAALRVEFSGSVQPDERALGIRAAAPLSVTGSATRDERGALAGQASFAGEGIAYAELGTLAQLEGEATLTDAAGALALDVTFRARAAEWIDVATVARVDGSAKLRGERIDARLALHGVALPELANADGASVRASFELASGTLSAHVEAPRALAPELARIEGLVADVVLANGALSGDVRVAKLVELSQPALIAPLRVDARLSGSLDRIAFSGKARTPGEGFVFDLTGALETASERLDLKIVLPETDLAAKTRQPDRVFPWLAGTIERARGTLGGEALATYVDGALAASAVVALNGVDIATEFGAVRGLMGVVAITGIDPLVTPPGQTIWMKSVEAGLPLGNGTVKLGLRSDGVLDIERGEWSFAGGKLAFSGAVPLDAADRTLALSVEEVSVEALLAALDFDGLSGTGVLSGVTPLVQRGDELLVRDGELRATQTGVIRFTSGAGGAALANKQPALAPVLGALEDLHYDELTLTLNGDISDRVEAKLHIRGRNPNFQKGRPVVLNVSVDLPLGSLLRAAAVATGVPDEIEERVQRAMGKEKP